MNQQRAFSVMAKPIGAVCNLDCKYCFYLEKENLYPDTLSFRMSNEVLESFIKQKIEAHKISEVSFAWQGGEPTLMGIDFFREVVRLQKKYSKGKKIHNAFQTNGILLTDEWCSFFNENNFLIGLSIDGPEELHNKFRLNKGGKPTFKNVMKGITFLKKHQVDFNTLTVVHKYNADFPIEIYDFLKEAGSGYMQFIPVVERIPSQSSIKGLTFASPSMKEAIVSDWSVEPMQYGNFLIKIFDKWVRNDVGKYFVQIFDVSLESWIGLQPSLCVFKETCGDAMIIEHNGDVYSCDHFVYPGNKLGNILEKPLESLINSKQQQKFGNDKNDTLPNYCLNCEVRFACNGECPKHRFIKTPDGEDGLNYLCAGYKIFFNHIDPYMKFMSDQLRMRKSPADVMEWIEQGKMNKKN